MNLLKHLEKNTTEKLKKQWIKLRNYNEYSRREIENKPILVVKESLKIFYQLLRRCILVHSKETNQT